MDIPTKMDELDIPANQDEWVEAEKFYISPEHHESDGTDICSEGCDWCMSDVDPNWEESDI